MPRSTKPAESQKTKTAAKPPAPKEREKDSKGAVKTAEKEKPRPPKAAAKEPEPPAPAAKPTAEQAFQTKIVNFISEHMAIEEAEITPNASLTEDLKLDEIDLAELLMRAEEEFGAREFDEEEWEELKTVDDFVGLIGRHVDKKKLLK